MKIVPANIGELLTPVGLAYWLCDDGHFQKAGGGVYFCTDSFSLVEVELLVSVLKKHFNLVGNIHSISNKKYNRIYLGISEMETFRQESRRDRLKVQKLFSERGVPALLAFPSCFVSYLSLILTSEPEM